MVFPRSFARALTLAAPLTLIAMPAQAQEPTDLAPLAERLAAPDQQRALAQTLSTLSQVLLDLPLAPLARAAAQAAGEDPDAVDPQLTLRQISPEAERVPGELSDRVPQMMGAMAGMAEGMQAMLPALRQMADRMEEAFPEGRAQQDYQQDYQQD